MGELFLIFLVALWALWKLYAVSRVVETMRQAFASLADDRDRQRRMIRRLRWRVADLEARLAAQTTERPQVDLGAGPDEVQGQALETERWFVDWLATADPESRAIVQASFRGENQPSADAPGDPSA
jgi:hypothetical protein